MRTEKNTIKSPEEVSKLMEDLWINHEAGNQIPKKNIFWVELPPLTKEEIADLNKAKSEEDTLEDLYGAWI